MINKFMEVWWKCNQCDTINNYLETKICEACDEPIGKEDEAKCIYEVADILYHSAVSAGDFNEAAGYFSKIPHYEDSAQKYKICEQRAQKILSDENNYVEATQHWDSACGLEKSGRLADAEKEYALAERQFYAIIPFKDSRQNWMKCHQTKEAVRQKCIYFQAEHAFSKAASIADYEKAARLFLMIAEYSDAKTKRDLCLKRIDEIKIEQQYQDILRQKSLAAEETDLNKKAFLYQEVINSFEKSLLSEKAKKLVEQCMASHSECLKQIEERRIQELYKKASAQFEEADRLSDNVSRAAAFSKILDEFKDYSEAKHFTQLLCSSRDKLNTANNNIAYDKAIICMNKANSIHEFTDAAAAFSALSGFKDSEKKKAECVSRADEIRRQDIYTRLEKIKRTTLRDLLWKH